LPFFRTAPQRSQVYCTIFGISPPHLTKKLTLLASVPLGVVTVTFPVVAPAGTVVVISVSEITHRFTSRATQIP
jgi:hypothetical protein